MTGRKLQAADLFCGAGGFTTGAQAAGVDVVLAVNHWRTAIYSHQRNHPGVRHLCARIEHVDSRNDATLPPLDLIMASPECTHHSIARGGRPVSDQKRQQPFALLDWIDAKRPRWVLVENVREFRDWGPLRNCGTERKPHWRPDPKHKGETFRAWMRSIEALGYRVDHQLLNAADFGAPTKRVRLFVLCRRGDAKRDMPWPEPTHAGRWVPAYTIIDWNRPCPSIFARKRPLAEKTLRRIEIGLKKFVGPFVAEFRNNQAAAGVDEPLSTICTSGAHHGLCMPFRFKMVGRNPGVSGSLEDPIPTIVAAAPNHAIIVPYITQYHNGDDGERRNYDLNDPLPTLDTQNRYGAVVPYFLPRQGYYDCHRDKPASRVDEPLNTITAHHGPGHVVMPYLMAINHGGQDDRSRSATDPVGTLTTKNGHSVVLPFLAKYYGTGSVQGVDEPLDTVTTRDRFGLAMASLIATMRELHVVDIGFRMLDPDELAAAQGFPADYYLHGTKAEQVKQVGNAVCPPVAESLCRAIGNADARWRKST